jgi:hypothetical protein
MSGGICMNIPRLRDFGALVLLLALLMTGSAQNAGQPSEKDGKLVVLVTWGDVDNTPATDVFIEAHGFVPKYNSEKSFLLKMSSQGHYESPLPPGVYDVFVSEGTSVPACKRVLIKAASTTDWTLKLENDYVYTEKSGGTNR